MKYDCNAHELYKPLFTLRTFVSVLDVIYQIENSLQVMNWMNNTFRFGWLLFTEFKKNIGSMLNA